MVYPSLSCLKSLQTYYQILQQFFKIVFQSKLFYFSQKFLLYLKKSLRGKVSANKKITGERWSFNYSNNSQIPRAFQQIQFRSVKVTEI